MTPFDALTDDLGDQRPDTTAADLPGDVAWTASLRQIRLTGTAELTGDTLEISGFAKVTDIGADGAAQMTTAASVTVELTGQCAAAARHVLEETATAGLQVTAEADAVVTSDGVALPGHGRLLVRGRDIYAGSMTLR